MTKLEQHIKAQYPFRFYLLRGMCLLTALFAFAAIIIYIVALAGGKFDFSSVRNTTITYTTTQIFLAILLNTVSIAGIYLMWTLRKAGFHLFFVTRVLLYYLPLFFSSTEQPALNELFVTALVMLLFGINLNIMKR